MNADVPIFPAPIVVSGTLSGIKYKDPALSVDLVLLHDADDKKEAMAGSRRSSLKAARAEKAELGANRVEYPPLQDQWYCNFARLQERLNRQHVSSKRASAHRAREEEFG